MNRDEVVRAVKDVMKLMFEEIDRVVMTLDKPEVPEQTIGPRHYAPPVDVKVVPEWEDKFLDLFQNKTLSHLVDESGSSPFWQAKDFIRAEMRKLGNDIKARLLPERYYPDVNQHVENGMWIDDAIYEALQRRGVI